MSDWQIIKCLVICTLWHICFKLCVTHAEPTTQAGVNVAHKKAVIANARWAFALVDDNLANVISPFTEALPFIAVDLGMVYKLTSIHVHAQKHWAFYMQGIGVPFSVYVWANKTNVCDLGGLFPWQLVKSGLEYKYKGHKITIPVSVEAQYIIIMPDMKNGTKMAQGLVMAELRAFGEKIPGQQEFKLPEDGPDVVNAHTEVRKQLLTGQANIYVEQAWMEYRQWNPMDVALAWHHNRINTMAVTRGKGRVIMMSGTKGLNFLLHNEEYKTLRENFRTWLSANHSGAKFVFVDEAYEVGDILLINRTATFDVEQVYKRVTDGENSAIFAYVGTKQEPQDDATSLMKKLSIGHLRHDGYYAGRYVPLPSLINTMTFIPYEYTLNLYLQSWKYFRTQNLPGTNEYELSKTEVQALIHKLLITYHEFANHYAICQRHPYWKNPLTDTAIANYNTLLLMQRGENIVSAPGVFVSPGDVKPEEKPVSYTITFNIDVWGNFFPTAAYAKPGVAFRYKVLNTTDPRFNSMNIRINPQTDNCGHINGVRRWPRLSVAIPLQREGIFGSAFGGPIVLRITSGNNVTIRLENVYRYAWFDIRDPKSVENWESERKRYNGVPYTMIGGDNMFTMLQTHYVVGMNAETIQWSVTYFDNAIKLMHNFRGANYHAERLETFVTDHQISAGDGHSGYPIMAYYYWGGGFGSVSNIKAGRCIGYPHEIGHNLQVWGMTLKWGTEVTNNMYIPVINHYLLGLKTFDGNYHPGSTDGDKNALVNQWTKREYVGVSVNYYSYLMRYFGTGIIGNVLPLVLHARVPLNTEERKVDYWVTNLCEQSGYDLIPFHKLWSFPMGQKTIDVCVQFPCFFPDDEITQRIPELKQTVISEHGRECNITTPKKTVMNRDVLQGLNTTRPQAIFLHPE